MKKISTQMFSFIMVVCLCVSLWSPVPISVASQEVVPESGTQYTIVLVDGEEEWEELPDLCAREVLQLNPKVKDTAGNYLMDTEFDYYSSDEKVVKVSQAGVVTAQELQENGTAEITISWTNPEDTTQVVEATFSITVNAILPTDVVIDREQKTLVVNDVYALTAQVKPQNASQNMEYSTSDETVAVVDSKGNVMAKGEGTAIITVAAKNVPSVRDSIEITVIDIPVRLELSQTAYSMKATDGFCLQAQVIYASGKRTAADAKRLTFMSGDETVVTVDDKGVVTALEQTIYPALALVQAKYEFSYRMDNVEYTREISASCQVSVTPIPVEDIALENNVSEITLQIGEKYTLLPIILPKNATNQAVKFKSSKTGVATVDSNGVITPKSIGETVITVSSKENSGVKVTFKVKVYQTVFNVAQLGVKGSDKKVDTEALNKILKYATLIEEPIIVVVPDGTYYIDDVLKIYSDTNLCLTDKAVIRRKASAGDSTMLCSKINENVGGYKQCENITITGGTWDGNATGKKTKNGNVMYFGHAQNIVITDTVVKRASGVHLIEFAGVKNAIVENVELYGYVMCPENNAKEADKEAIQLDYCSSISAPAMKPYDGTPCKNITIRNCNIHDYMAGVGTHTEGSKAASNIRIENNTFTNITNACVNLRKFKNVNIEGNKAKNCTTFVYASNSQGSIMDNKVTNGTSYKPKTSSGLRAKNGITISNGSSFTIENNTFEKAKSNGICIWNGSNATVKNNKLKNNKMYGIRTQGSSVKLKKNSFSKNKKGLYDTYEDATIKSSDDIRAYYVDIEKSYQYRGKVVKPKVKIKGLNKKYYKVSYKNNKKPGTATVIIKGKGKVKQTLKLKYKITR